MSDASAKKKDKPAACLWSLGFKSCKHAVNVFNGHSKATVGDQPQAEQKQIAETSSRQAGRATEDHPPTQQCVEAADNSHPYATARRVTLEVILVSRASFAQWSPICHIINAMPRFLVQHIRGQKTLLTKRLCAAKAGADMACTCVQRQVPSRTPSLQKK